ncbi:phage portal protein [Cellulomonas sp. HZM]|uniref:phage portal protein n=1 Tax=Cellulomonas sp. HZM TaxID=1454010 RepID=UPI000493A54B|nr:phage portal protein [Cellulomonas sp. HZM]
MSLLRRSTLAGVADATGRALRRGRGPEVTPTSALRQSVAWGAQRLRADLISVLPVDVYRKVGAINASVPAPGVLVEPSEDADGQPMTIGDWLYSGQMSLDSVGNNVGVITRRDSLGLPAAIDLAGMDEVRMRIKDRRITRYWINGEKHEPRDIWHERQHRVAGMPVGLSPVAYAAMYLAGADAAAQFALDWFANGTVPSAILKNTEKVLNPEQADRTARRFRATVAAGEVFVTGKDWTYDPISAKAAEAEFIEQMQYSDVALCRFYGVPADLVDVAVQSSTLNYANITQRNLQLLVMHLGSPITRREKALSRLTPRPRYVKLNRDAILAMDPKSRAELFKLQIDSRTRTPDEARALVDEQPLTEADYAQFERLWPTSRPPQQQTSGGS